MKAIEIINETVEFYSEDTSRRALTEKFGDCMYTTDNGNHCAVGRCLSEQYQTTTFISNDGADVDDLDKNYCGIDNILQEKYKGQPKDLWQQLQNLHDSEFYWCKDGLTKDGEAKVKSLLEEYK